jgi:trimeric autotransporter adhesin
MRKQRRTIKSAIKVLTAAVGLTTLPILNIPLYANPAGEAVVGGSASFDRNGSTLNITTSDRAIINWQDFSIGLGETTRFLQPSSTSAALNRVVTGNPSSLLGNLEANGQIFLINPNGILVGNGATINTSSFIASTLDVSNEEFMAGKDMTFSGSSTASINNQGNIQALNGDIFLIANQVDNSGSLTASKGLAGIAAAEEVLIKHTGDERVFVKAPGLQTYGLTGIQNAGAISAAQVELKAASSNPYSLAINNQGVIRATGTKELNGRVLLVGNGGTIQNSGEIYASLEDGTGGHIAVAAGRNADRTSTVISTGTIDASGTKGGSIEITGDQVGLTDQAVVNASGTTAGGTILVGGGFQGNNSDVQNAKATFVGKDVSLRADATGTEGDGGEVIVWADEVTRYFGDIKANGAGSGKGGFVEVSGKEHLLFDGKINAGLNGSILLDPRDIFIDDVGLNDNLVIATGVAFDSPNTTDDISISDESIEALTGNFTIFANRNLLINQSLELSNITDGETATFRSGGGLTVSTGVNLSTGGGGLTFNASDGGLDSGTAALVIDGNIVELNGVKVKDVRINNKGGSGGTFVSGNILASGQVFFQSSGGDTQVTGAIIAPTMFISLVSGTSPNFITFNGQFTGANDINTLNLDRGNNVTFNDIDGVLIRNQFGGASVLTGDVVISAGGDVTDNQRITQVSGSFTVNTTGNITLDNGHAISGPISLNGNNVIFANTSANATTTILGASTITGNLTLDGVNISQTGALNVTGDTAITASSGNLILENVGNTFGNLTLSGANVSVVETGNLNSGNATATGTLKLQSVSGDVILNTGAVLTAGGDVTLAAGANFVNNSSASPITSTAGRFMIYSTSEAANTLGGLTANHTEYSTTYPAAPAAATGNVFLFTSADPNVVTPPPVTPPPVTPPPVTPPDGGGGTTPSVDPLAALLASIDLAEVVDTANQLIDLNKTGQQLVFNAPLASLDTTLSFDVRLPLVIPSEPGAILSMSTIDVGGTNQQ